MNSDLLNVRETALRMRVSVPTVRSWVCQGTIPFVRLGRRILFDRNDIDAFIAENKHQAVKKQD